MRFNVASFVLLASFVIAINAKNDINRVKIARRSDIGSQRSSLLNRRDDGSAAPAATDPTAAVAPSASDATAAASDAAAAAAVPPAPKWDPSASVDCTYNSDGCLTQASTHGCPIQVQPPKKGKGTSCSTGGGGGSDYKKRLFSLPNQLLNLDLLNCDTLCLLSECPPQNDCSVQSSDGSFINVQALDCDNLYLLSSATKK